MRLLANLLTEEEIGVEFRDKYAFYYKDIMRKIVFLLKDNDIKVQQERVSCGLSWLANLTFYDKAGGGGVGVQDLELVQCKGDAVCMLNNYIMQIEDEEICCEGLRVLANLSRSKVFLYSHIHICLQLIDLIIILNNYI